MRISIINSYDSEGGAARSAYRLHQGLISAGISSTFFTQAKKSDDVTVKRDGSKFHFLWSQIRPVADSIPVRFYRSRDKRSPFSPAILPASEMIVRGAFSNADIVNLHWIADGFIGIESLRQVSVPIVWTLHDSWPFTGGCHLPLDCDNFTQRCGTCFRLGSTRRYDLSRLVLERKRRAWAELNLTIVTPSQWLAALAKKSALFRNRRIEVIPNGLDLERYKPIEKKLCRKMLGIADDAKVILYSAQSALMDRNKGFQFIQPAISHLKGGRTHQQLVIFVCGTSQPQDAPELGASVRYIGRLHDDLSLAVLYSAADVLLMPSMQENLPNTIMEAMACGTPAVAFDIGGIADLVEHRKNGYLAKPFDCEDLAKGLAWALDDDLERQRSCSDSCREKISKNFALADVAKRYQALYQDLMPG